MFSIIQSEHLKHKRTFSKKLIVIAPLFFCLYTVIVQIFLPLGVKPLWGTFLQLVFNWWPFIFIPLGIALLGSLTENREEKSGGNRSLRVHNINPIYLWIAKILVLAYYMLLSSIVLIAVILLTGTISAAGSVPIFTILKAAVIIWFVSLSLIPIHLFVSAWKGTVVSMGLSIVGMFAGVIVAPGSHWFLLPWSWPLRLMCPVVGVHPNGVTLAPSDPLLDPSVIPIGIFVSLAAFLILTMLTAQWDKKREVK
ncbi:lantibiotic immunity ABC transporter MutE/EpiE family permease subunit [Clostridium sp. E02]|uniref:lantibiotic immunity ABC transporter MutE/EpiE family permease subunit n=1 Tax=Clostridium sp. E02 TaxID=2487134 RepID=UPI000F53B02E|nr:lantibiotic immunity ABC transporter MutE/EpiE family permease subunit [Clostridium sp. E02]